MGKLQAFEIQYNHPQNVFHAGSVMAGRILVSLQEEMKMRAIKLHIFGRAKVHWTKTKGGKHKHTVHYRAEEIYINSHLLVWGDGQNSKMHPAGTHTYDFQIELPASLPSTFEGGYGYVRYFCKATIDKPWKFDHDVKVPFTVLSILDLNLQPIEFRQMVEASDRTSVDCCCCISGEVNVTMKLNKRVFVPGEPIVIYAEIHNNSNTEMDGSRVSLKQYTDFYGASDNWFSSGNLKPKSTSCFLTSLERPRIQPGKTDIWENEELTVPAIPPSELVGCQIINIRYILRFYVTVNYGTNIKLSTDLIIGTVPLIETYRPPQAVITQQPLAGPVPTAPGPPPDMPPPSYEACVLGAVSVAEEDDNEYTRGAKEYAPMYTYYNWNQTGFASTPSAPPQNKI